MFTILVSYILIKTNSLYKIIRREKIFNERDYPLIEFYTNTGSKFLLKFNEIIDIFDICIREFGF